MFLFQIAVTNQVSIISQIVTFLATSAFVLKVYYFLKIITIIYAAVLAIAVILVIASARPKKVIKEIEQDIEAIIAKEKEGPEAYGSRWQEILKMAEGKDESSWHLAVTEADKFFDNVMRRLGYSGDNFGERLKQIHPTEVSNLNDVWDAHRTRNLLTHDVNFKISQDDARRAVGVYERAMKDMDVL